MLPAAQRNHDVPKNSRVHGTLQRHFYAGHDARRYRVSPRIKLLSTESTFIFAGSYAVICVASVAVMAAQPAHKNATASLRKSYRTVLQQFTIGALLSTSLLFYWFSGALSVSWPVVSIVAVLMVFNEVLPRDFFMKPVVQCTVLYLLHSSRCRQRSQHNTQLHRVRWTFVAGGVTSLRNGDSRRTLNHHSRWRLSNACAA